MRGNLGQGPVEGGKSTLNSKKGRKKFNRPMLRCMTHSIRYIILAFFIQMDFPIHIITISMDLSILYLMGHINIYLYVKINFNLANSADRDEMTHYAAFHVGLHCLPKYMITCTCIQI